MSYEKKKKFIIDIGYYTVIGVIFFLVLKFGISWFMPFIVAFCITAATNSLAIRVSKAFRVKKKFAACFCAAVLYFLTVILIIALSFNGFQWLKNIFFNLPNIYVNDIEPALESVFDAIQRLLIIFDPELQTSVEQLSTQVFQSLGSTISSVSVTAITALSGVITKVPVNFVKTLITIIATFFIASDYDNIVTFIMKQFSPKWQELIRDIKKYTASTLIQYLKSYILIMSITFVELTTALFLLKVENFVVIAFIISIFDILPVLGAGGVIIPWAIIAILQGKYAFGIGMLLTYLIMTVIRQIIEPKIVGDQVGLHPIATLMAMFIGAGFMGVFGLFLFPISLVIIKKLNDTGKINIIK